MEGFTFAELADMHLEYGAAGENARNAVRMYQSRFPNRYLPNHQTFSSLHRRLRERGTFTAIAHDNGRPRRVRTPEVEEEVTKEKKLGQVGQQDWILKCVFPALSSSCVYRQEFMSLILSL